MRVVDAQEPAQHVVVGVGGTGGERALDVAELAAADADGLFDQLVDLAGVEDALQDDIAVTLVPGLQFSVRHRSIMAFPAAFQPWCERAPGWRIVSSLDPCRNG